MSVVADLSDDVLVEVLRRLPARSLAASRQVCQAWHAIIDEHKLLLRHLLPHSVRGIFVNYQDHGKPHFFARPMAAPERPRMDGRLDFIELENEHHWTNVLDHCNGLVLYWDNDAGWFYACNPLTQRWKRLPWFPNSRQWKKHAFLVYNPTVSKHYKVLLAPRRPQMMEATGGKEGDAWRLMECPPSRWTWHEFSSRTGRWRDRVFVREGEAAGKVADFLLDNLPYSMEPRWRFAVHWKEALYVHCHGEYVARMSLSNAKYRVIKSPIDCTESYERVKSFLGRSEKGVYFASIDRRRLRVWILNEHLDKTEWMLKHDRVLRPDDWWGVVIRGNYHQIKCDGPWILDENEKIKTKNDVEWSSDDDDVIQNVDWNENVNEEYMYPDSFQVLGFHPYKEVIFLTTIYTAVAYHLSSWKVQFLGILKPKDWNCGVYDSFVYTPCICPA